jgi:hypothetical protein
VSAPLSEQQRAALARAVEPGSGGAVVGHGRTVASLVGRGLATPVVGWYEKSVARRVGRYGATTSTWGVTGYRITDAGKAAIKAPCVCEAGRVQQATASGHMISLPCPTCTASGGVA